MTADADALLDTLVFEISTDPTWRARLFAAADGDRFVLELSEVVRYGGASQRVVIFRDGVTEGGDVVFGFEVEGFPDLTRYSTNNPAVL